MMASDSLDRTGRLVAVGVFVALVADGMDLQMLALALPSISKDLQLSSVMAGALATYTLALAAGTKLGPYEIQSAIGAGGMSASYAAMPRREPRHQRQNVLGVGHG